MKLFVTGAGGMLGADLMRAGELAGHDVHGFARAELDVTDAALLRRTFEALQPEGVINAAAYTDVDGAEAAESEAIRVNGDGAGLVAAAAEENGAKVVYVSTDYVFDGGKRTPYVESDEPAPLSAYGRSKLAGEGATAEANPHSFIVRSSWLFGRQGASFVEKMLGLASGRDEVHAVSDQVGSPTFTGHLANGILELIEGDAYGLHHIAASGECSRLELVRELFDQADVACAVQEATTEMFPAPAPRPAYSALATERVPAITLPTWQEGLAAYLSERAEGGQPGGPALE